MFEGYGDVECDSGQRTKCKYIGKHNIVRDKERPQRVYWKAKPPFIAQVAQISLVLSNLEVRGRHEEWHFVDQRCSSGNTAIRILIRHRFIIRLKVLQDKYCVGVWTGVTNEMKKTHFPAQIRTTSAFFCMSHSSRKFTEMMSASQSKDNSTRIDPPIS